ncbi:MAG: cupin domain-containing protein [Pseudomonadales bacterium]
MKAYINSLNPDDEFYIAERCFITELSNSPDDPDVSIAKARIEPGVTTAWHRLKDTTERYVLISGKGLVEVGDLPAKEVTFGDTVIIPAMCRQRITNTGSEDLIFLAICSPRFLVDCYEELSE